MQCTAYIVTYCYINLQVQHVFSDKTGTLTENKMIFKACSVGEILFTEKNDNPGKVMELRNFLICV